MTTADISAEILLVEKSPIEAGGRARINTDILEKLEVETGDNVVVSSDKRDILVKIYDDDMVEKNKIILRSRDVEKLGVEEKEEVTIRKHKKLLSKLL
ncbi:MAG: hypothetical protein V5A76_04470 [Candidatus Thermoplasmatota archaeon]